ncbi:EamA domain-containing membrane protein RarD [Jannaschia faecimaris]|uniref:EamA domain-containing membrane protein RarD n=1 Tax=Jannaschia faecimaris TaxID=1244108 RepID=A0A1H3JAG7_9RHOB|nr:DMT family transporter [Jannaschia faecimaris]SDY36174.1 EamA domain-containing membrane protein RarD [Jannaschia faecimaris]
MGSAIALRLAAAVFATLLGFCVHGASETAGTAQVVFLRALLSIPPLLIWALLTGPVSDLRPKAPRKHLLRGTLGGVTMALNFYALAQLPVTSAQTLSYLTPVLSIPAAVILLGERLSVRTVIAVALGFAGMMAMLYTASANPDWGWPELSGMIAGIASAFLMALIRVQIRAMTATETVMSIALSFAVIVTAMGFVAVLLTGWTPMTGSLWLWLGAAGLLGAATHIAATESAARAPISTLATYDYAGLVFAVMLDFALFSHLPSAWGWLGIVLIATAGLMTALSGRAVGSGLRAR